MANQDREKEGWKFVSELRTDRSCCSLENAEEEALLVTNGNLKKIKDASVGKEPAQAVATSSSNYLCGSLPSGQKDLSQRALDEYPPGSQSRSRIVRERRYWTDNQSRKRINVSSVLQTHLLPDVRQPESRSALPRSVDSLMNPSTVSRLFPQLSDHEVPARVRMGIEYRDRAYQRPVGGFSTARNYDDFLDESRNKNRTRPAR